MSESTQSPKPDPWSTQTGSQNVTEGTSSAVQGSPRLSHRGLTTMLSLMCIVPVATVLLLWNYMPQVYEGQLKAKISSTGLPDQEFYAVDYRERDEFQGGDLVVTNLEDEEWTQLNIQVNKYYQIRDNQPIPAGSTRIFRLDSFLTRTGARFSLRYNELKSARIYARRPDSNRATYYCEFADGQAVPTGEH